MFKTFYQKNNTIKKSTCFDFGKEEIKQLAFLPQPIFTYSCSYVVVKAFFGGPILESEILIH